MNDLASGECPTCGLDAETVMDVASRLIEEFPPPAPGSLGSLRIIRVHPEDLDRLLGAFGRVQETLGGMLPDLTIEDSPYLPRGFGIGLDGDFNLVATFEMGVE